MPSFSSWHLSKKRTRNWATLLKSGVHLQRANAGVCLLATSATFTSGRFNFMYIVVIFYCEELGKEGRYALLDYKTDLLRPLYNAPILQTTDFCSESQTKTEHIAGLISPISSKPQLQMIQDYILRIITVCWSVYCSGPPALIGYTALTSTSVALAYPVDYSCYA